MIAAVRAPWTCVAAALALAASVPAAIPPPPPRLLLVTVTKGWRHESIPDLVALVKAIGQTGIFQVEEAATDADLLAKTTPDALARYRGAVFASTTGDI